MRKCRRISRVGEWERMWERERKKERGSEWEKVRDEVRVRAQRIRILPLIKSVVARCYVLEDVFIPLRRRRRRQRQLSPVSVTNFAFVANSFSFSYCISRSWNWRSLMFFLVDWKVVKMMINLNRNFAFPVLTFCADKASTRRRNSSSSNKRFHRYCLCWKK